MKFNAPLIHGTLIKRYKRFLADVQLESGEVLTAHTANTGSMLGLTDPGNLVYLSFHDNPQRKLKYSWELVQVGNVLVGINTSRPNHLVEEALQNGTIQELQGYQTLNREVRYGKNSRVDILLSNGDTEKCYVEVKNVTLVQDGVAYFPDAVTERGLKHLNELMQMVEQGHRAVMVYVLQRSDGEHFSPADHIDPAYGQALRRAVQQGVEVLVYRAETSLQEIRLRHSVECRLP
jgi:sugar fermentation stimulation protein A